MKILTRIGALALVVLTLASAGSSRQKPRNLILFIGDGMGVSHVYAAITASGNTMTFPSFPVTGFSRTHSANNYSTDFATHAPLRYEYRSIAKQYINGAADIFIGGGRRYFVPTPDSTGKINHEEDVVSGLSQAGYDVTYDLESFIASKSDRIAGLMADGDIPMISDGRDPQYLARATAKAIEVLSRNRAGFILMVEGSRIDDAGHGNNTSMVIDEVIDMDRAVAVAYDFAKRDGKTLIVVTADHETGGMSITGGNLAKREVKAEFSFTGHSGVMVPVFAFGPGAVEFTGIQENTDLFHDFFRLLSLDRKRR